MKRLYTLITSLLLLTSTTLTWAQCIKPQTNFTSCNYTAIGHRGYPSVYPENTLLGLEELFKRGVKYAEVDVSITKDSVYVLFHDNPSVFRTTNGSGRLNEYTLAELKQLDAGSWKSEQFKDVRIPTLVEALKVAEKYDAYLYLDTKNYNAHALKTTMDEAGVSPTRFMPSITYISQAAAFRAVLPNTPWIWYGGGGYPDDINSDTFYQQCKDLGCIAFEISSSRPGDSLWNTFKTNVNKYGMKTWVFTVNDNAELDRLVKLGVNGIETDRAWESSRFICNGIEGVPFEDNTIANYLFDGDLKAKKVGSQIRLLNYQNTPTNELPEFASCSVWGIPFIENFNKTVMKVHKFDSSNGFMVYNNSRDETNGILENTYTLIMDVYIPTVSMGNYISLLQTSTENLNDADIFIDPSGGIGIDDVYHGTVAPNTWNRIAIVLDEKNNIIKKYINGVYVGKNDIESSSRWAIWTSSKSGDTQGFLLFADDDGETAEMYVSAVQLRNYVVTDALISSLGAPKKTGIKLSNANIWNVSVSTAYSDSTIIDYENKTYFFVIPSTNTADSVLLSYQLTSNAVSNTTLNKYIKLYTPFEFKVTSEDGSKHANWVICTRKAGTNTGLNYKKIDVNKSLIAYPNPASKQLFIDNLTNNPSSYQIIDMLGRDMQQGSISNQQNVINTTLLKTGIYFITITQKEYSQTIKFSINN